MSYAATQAASELKPTSIFPRRVDNGSYRKESRVSKLTFWFIPRRSSSHKSCAGSKRKDLPHESQGDPMQRRYQEEISTLDRTAERAPAHVATDHYPRYKAQRKNPTSHSHLVTTPLEDIVASPGQKTAASQLRKTHTQQQINHRHRTSASQ